MLLHSSSSWQASVPGIKANPSDSAKVANFLFPNGFSVAGTEPAVQRLVGRAGAPRLPVQFQTC